MIPIAAVSSGADVPARSTSSDPLRSTDGRFGRMVEDLSREPEGEGRPATEPAGRESAATDAAATPETGEGMNGADEEASEEGEAATAEPEPEIVEEEDLVDLILAQFRADEGATDAPPAGTADPADAAAAMVDGDAIPAIAGGGLRVDGGASVPEEAAATPAPVRGAEIASDLPRRGESVGIAASAMARAGLHPPDAMETAAPVPATPAAVPAEDAAAANVAKPDLPAAAKLDPVAKSDLPAGARIEGAMPAGIRATVEGVAPETEIRIRRTENAPAPAASLSPATIAPAVEARLALAALAGGAKGTEPGARAAPPETAEEVPFLGSPNSAGPVERTEAARMAAPVPTAPGITLAQGPGIAFAAGAEGLADPTANAGSPDPAVAIESGSSRIASVSQQILHQPGLGADRPAAAQVAQIAEAVRGRESGLIEVALSPEELGRVKISMQRTDTGFQIVVIADRDDTLNLLRRNGDMLESAFRDLDMGDVNLSFGQNSHGRSAPTTLEDMIVRSPAQPPMAEIAMPRPAPLRSTTGLDRLDMKI